MDRRTLIKNGTLALAGLGLTGCGASLRGGTSVPAKRLPLDLAPPRVTSDRVIRTTVGLRPHRDSGFVLRAEKFDAKTIVHDYGFGGAGMSLSWGCGALVADLARQTGEHRAAVIGCGAPGVCAARQLQRRGWDVTIYTATVPPETTSNMSMAGFTPTTALIEATARTPVWDAQFREAADISYRQLQLMAGSNYGVYWIDTYNATDDPSRQPGPPAEGDLLPDQLRPGRFREVLGPGEHPFPTKYAIRSTALAIEPSIYMDAIVRDFLTLGGKIVIRKFDTPRDLMSLPESVVVNCTGLGSFTLFGDTELVPIKGQLTVLVPQPDVRYRANGRAASGVTASMNPRTDGVVIGNLQDRGNWSLEPDPDVRQRNMDAAIEFFGAMKRDAGPKSRKAISGFG